MEPLNLPKYAFKVKSDGERKQIFDEVRRKYIALTPEEWVRQHYLNFLITEKGYPKSLIGVEQGLEVNSMARRTDIVLHNNKGKAIVIVECKAPTIKITQSVMDQVAQYNIALKVPYLVVTNGLSHYYCKIDHTLHSYSFLKELPSYSMIS